MWVAFTPLSFGDVSSSVGFSFNAMERCDEWTTCLCIKDIQTF